MFANVASLSQWRWIITRLEDRESRNPENRGPFRSESPSTKLIRFSSWKLVKNATGNDRSPYARDSKKNVRPPRGNKNMGFTNGVINDRAVSAIDRTFSISVAVEIVNCGSSGVCIATSQWLWVGIARELLFQMFPGNESDVMSNVRNKAMDILFRFSFLEDKIEIY